MSALWAAYGRFQDWRGHTACPRFDKIVLASALILNDAQIDDDSIVGMMGIQTLGLAEQGPAFDNRFPQIWRAFHDESCGAL